MWAGYNAGYIIWNIIALISGLDNVLKTVQTFKKKKLLFFFIYLFFVLFVCFFVFVIFLQNLLHYDG